MSKYDQDLSKIVAEISREWDGFGDQALADGAGLHVSTVRRLLSRETKHPYFRTVWKLAKAVGMEVRLHRIKKLKRAA